MKYFFGFYILGQLCFAQASTETFTGHIFTFKNQDYITFEYRTTNPQYLIEWKDKRKRKDICFSNTKEGCPKYEIRFVRQTDSSKRHTFTKAEVVDPFEP